MCKVIFFLVLILVSRSVNFVSGLITEDIIGGYVARHHTMKYQVSIQVKLKFSEAYFPICGGGIISDDLIISAAHCFLDSSGILYEGFFSIVAGTNHLDSQNRVKIGIEKLYVPGFEESFNFYDISLAKLEPKLNLANTYSFRKLKLPRPNSSFFEKTGITAGFGFTSVNTEIDEKTGVETLISGNLTRYLKYAFVKVIEDNQCKFDMSRLSSNQMCAKMITSYVRPYGGICTGDSGSPLVVNGIVVGIASKGSVDCNDTKYGFIYSKVSSFLSFIHNVLDGSTDLALIHSVAVN